jgi:hypothetical protein
MPTLKLRQPHKIAEAFAGPDGRSTGSRWRVPSHLAPRPEVPPHSPALATHRAMTNTSIKQRISAHDLADQLAEQRVNVPLTRLHQSGYAHPVKVSL